MKRKPTIQAKNPRQPKRIVRFSLSGHEWVHTAALEAFPMERIVLEDKAAGAALVRKPHQEPQAYAYARRVPKREKGIAKWTFEELLQRMDDLGEIEVDFQQALRNEECVSILDLKAGVLLAMLTSLAERGGFSAMLALTKLAFNSVINLNRIAKALPRDFHLAATFRDRWPVFMSPHPLLCDDHRSLFRVIRLGKGLRFDLSAGSRWVKDEAGQIAAELIQFLNNFRVSYSHFDPAYQPIGERAAKLGEFDDKDSALAWWKVAEELFLHSYPAPERIPELAKLVTAPSHRKTAGRMRQRILGIIKSRFVSFAKKKTA